MRFEIIQTPFFISSVCLFVVLVFNTLETFLRSSLHWECQKNNTKYCHCIYVLTRSGKHWKYHNTIIKVHPVTILATKNTNNKTVANVALKGIMSEAHWQSFFKSTYIYKSGNRKEKKKWNCLFENNWKVKLWAYVSEIYSKPQYSF